MSRLNREQRLMLFLLVLSCAVHLALLKVPLPCTQPVDRLGPVAVRLCSPATPALNASQRLAGSSAPAAQRQAGGVPLAAAPLVPASAPSPAKTQLPLVAQDAEPANGQGVAAEPALAGESSAGDATQGAASMRDVAFGSASGPRFKQQVVPTYPRKARLLGLGGRVVLRLAIDETGRLVEVEVLESAPHGLTEAALKAVWQSTYYPALADGRPVSTRAQLPVRFSLAGAP